jgi:hypothetical protein
MRVFQFFQVRKHGQNSIQGAYREDLLKSAVVLLLLLR